MYIIVTYYQNVNIHYFPNIEPLFHLNFSILLSIIDGYFNSPLLLGKFNNGKKLNLINTYDLEHKK